MTLQLSRYRLDGRARGYSDATITHTDRCVRSFSAYCGGIGDVATVDGDDLRRFIIHLKDQPASPSALFREFASARWR